MKLELATLSSIKTINWQRPPLLLALAAAAAAGLIVWLPLPFALQLAAAALLALFLPGWLLLLALDFTLEDRAEQIILAIAVSYGVTTLLSLVLLYVAGFLSTPLILSALGLTALLFGLIGFLHPAPPASPPSRLPPLSSLLSPLSSLLCFLLPMTVAAFFAFTNLGYADYWGDEMNGLLRAISAIAGHPQTIFEHTKGPIEILLPAVFGLLAGRFEPFTLRLPFALAYIAGAGGFYLLGARLFDRKTAVLAALVLVINGLYVAFGRMVQYQAVVFLMTALSLLMAYRFYRRGGFKALALSLFLFGVGLLAHFDMLLVLPPLGYLIWRRYGWRWPAWRDNWPRLAAAGLVLGAVTAIFYLPFLLNSHVTETSSYLTRRIIGSSSWPGNNFDQLYQFAVMYNSSYYVALIALLGGGLMAADLVRLLSRHARARWLWVMVGATLVLALLALIANRVTFVPLLFTLLLLGLLVATPTLSTERKMIYIWVGVSFIGYVFLVDYPRTHLRIIYPGWSLLVALALVALGKLPAGGRGWFRPGVWPRALSIGLMALAVLLFGLFAYYEYLLFVDDQTEYILTYPEHKNGLYWEDADFPFGSRRLYGAPHRIGWQMIHSLYSQGHFQGDWSSNDQGSNLFWYTLGSPRNPCFPRYYFLTHFEQRDRSEDAPELDQAGYVQIGQVWNGDRRQIELYEFAPLGRPTEIGAFSEPSHYSSFIEPADFRSFPHQEIEPEPATRLPAPPVFSPSPDALQQIAAHYGDERIVKVQDKVSLIGYDLDETWAQPGGAVVLTLYWQAVEPVNLPYKIFTHLESAPQQANAPRLWAQSDDFPACGTQSTQRWSVGQPVADRHVLWLPADLPPGDYVIRTGLYEPQTNLRMDRLDPLGNPQGVSFELTGLTIPPTD